MPDEVAKTNQIIQERNVVTRAVRRLPDDTEQYVPANPQQRAYLEYDHSHFPSQLPQKAIDSFLALQIGLWQILAPLPIYSINTEALLRGVHEYREYQLERIFFDWAEMKNSRVPNNSVCILGAGPTTYSYPGRETFLVDESRDKFCPGTILQVSHTAEVDMDVIAWLNNKDDRGGLRRALEDAFAEPLDDRAGRRVIIPQYWGQPARYSLQEVQYVDDTDTAKDNSWPLVARFRCDIAVTKLVRSEGDLREVLNQVTTTTNPIG